MVWPVRYVGVKVDFRHDINVLAKLQQKYGTIYTHKIVKSGDDINISQLFDFLRILVCEWYRFEGLEPPVLSNRWLARFGASIGWDEIFKRINHAVEANMGPPPRKYILEDIDDEKPIDFDYIYHMGLTRFCLPFERIGFMTMVEFDKRLQTYKNIFDLEVQLKCSGKTYKSIDKKYSQGV